jgi:hypothetical protein
MYIYGIFRTIKHDSSRKEAREGKNGKRGLTIAAT